jgi:hypothetical protein
LLATRQVDGNEIKKYLPRNQVAIRSTQYIIHIMLNGMGEEERIWRMGSQLAFLGRMDYPPGRRPADTGNRSGEVQEGPAALEELVEERDSLEQLHLAAELEERVDC